MSQNLLRNSRQSSHPGFEHYWKEALSYGRWWYPRAALRRCVTGSLYPWSSHACRVWEVDNAGKAFLKKVWAMRYNFTWTVRRGWGICSSEQLQWSHPSCPETKISLIGPHPLPARLVCVRDNFLVLWTFEWSGKWVFFTGGVSLKLASSLFLNLLLPPIGDRSESVIRRLRVILQTPLILKVKQRIWEYVHLAFWGM